MTSAARITRPGMGKWSLAHPAAPVPPKHLFQLQSELLDQVAKRTTSSSWASTTSLLLRYCAHQSIEPVPIVLAKLTRLSEGTNRSAST